MPPTPVLERMAEVTPDAHPAIEAGTGGRHMRVQLIDAGWGTSGYYSADVLRTAAQEGVIPAGTHMYLDHPSRSDAVDRPERSVRDLAAVTTGPAVFNEATNALDAPVRLFAPWESLTDLADDIGVSIRGTAEGEPGTAEGRNGLIFTRLVGMESVDFVTRAGRGGRVLEVLEAAVEEKRNIGQWAEARMHANFTALADDMYGDGRLTREERIALSGAIGSALASFVETLTAAAPQLYERDIWDDAPEAIVSENVPVTDPAGQSTTTETKGHVMPTIEEGRLAQLEADAGRVPTLESERDAANARAEESTARANAAEARELARPIAAKVIGASKTIPAAALAALVEAVVAGMPAGADADAVKAAAEAARTAKEAEVAAILEAHGHGKVTDLGRTTPTGGVTEADVNKSIAAAFGRQIREGA